MEPEDFERLVTYLERQLLDHKHLGHDYVTGFVDCLMWQAQDERPMEPEQVPHLRRVLTGDLKSAINTANRRIVQRGRHQPVQP